MSRAAAVAEFREAIDARRNGQPVGLGPEWDRHRAVLAEVVEFLRESPTMGAWAFLDSLNRRARRCGFDAALETVHDDDLHDLAHVVETCARGRSAVVEALETEWAKRWSVRAALLAFLNLLDDLSARATELLNELAPARVDPPQPPRAHRSGYPRPRSFCLYRRHLAPATSDDPAPAQCSGALARVTRQPLGGSTADRP
jgi:hypothetical protein